MITEDYMSFETAKLLKKKGFENDAISCINVFKGHIYKIQDRVIDADDDITIPTLQMAVKWLREKGFHIFVSLEIDYDEDERGGKWYHDAAYYPEIRRVSDGKIMYDDGALYATPEQAYEVAIKYCLENLI